MRELIEKLPVEHDSEFASMYFDATNSILYHFYKDNSTAKMNVEGYKTELTAVLQTCLRTKVLGLVADNRNFEFPITPELQDWTDKNIFAKHIYLKSCAVIVSQDLIGQLAIEQVVDENTNDGLIFRFSII